MGTKPQKPPPCARESEAHILQGRYVLYDTHMRDAADSCEQREVDLKMNPEKS